jgi:hypothetical protein
MLEKIFFDSPFSETPTNIRSFRLFADPSAEDNTVVRLSTLTKYLSLSLALGSSLAAQEKWVPSFKFAAGQVMGGAKDMFVPTGSDGGSAITFGGGVELAYKLDNASSLVYDIGYRFFPGSSTTVSYIPATIPVTTGVPTIYETRVRKTESKGWSLGAKYRKDAFTEGMYWQAGVSLGFFSTEQTDTGSRLYTTGAGGPASAVGTEVISSSVAAKTTTISPSVGLGYRFNDHYSGELNLSNAKFESAAAGKKTGQVIDLSFGIRF